jgi:hypothetical protein
MSKKFNISIFSVLMVVMLMVGVAAAAVPKKDVHNKTTVPKAAVPDGEQPDSSAYVGYGWNGYLPAFKDAKGVSIPFMPARILPPIGYQGDFYVDEFTDAKIKQAWSALKVKNPEAAKKILAGLSVNVEYRIIGSLDPKGSVNGNDNLNLADIRRPAFFGQAPYFEEIGRVEQDTYTVEFTVPRSLCERLQLKLTEPVKLRGWFIKGRGVPDAKGQKSHAVFIFNMGCGDQFCAIQHPDAPMYVYDFQTKQYRGFPEPNKIFQSEQWQPRDYRRYIYSFNQAGFDVLVVDKRGHGYSGGFDCDTSEHAEDIFRMINQLESGDGLTVLTPTGQLLQGKQMAGLLLRGRSAKQIPVVIGGESEGAIMTCYAMQKNFVGWTAFNKPDQNFSPAKKYNIKAAILLSDFSAGLGYYSNPDLSSTRWEEGIYQEAAYRVEKNIMVLPTSEILSNIDKWPAVFFGHGLWDSLMSPVGTYESYRRAKGLKELVFYRGMHGSQRGGPKNVAYLINKMTMFAVRAVVNPVKKYPEFKSFKEAVLSSPPYWEPSSRP